MTARRGKGKGKEMESDDDEDNDLAEEVIEEREKLIRKALFSTNLIDLANSVLKMEFGRWNNRPISTKAMTRLKESFTREGVQAFELENALPLILRREHLDREAVNI